MRGLGVSNGTVPNDTYGDAGHAHGGSLEAGGRPAPERGPAGHAAQTLPREPQRRGAAAGGHRLKPGVRGEGNLGGRTLGKPGRR